MRTDIIILIMAIALIQLAVAQNRIPHSVVGNGGETSGGNNFAISGTVGQTAVGVVVNDTNRVAGGFWPLVADVLVAVEPLPDDATPLEFRLEQNYPNPFNPATTIRYTLPKAMQVTLEIFNIRGQRVAVLQDGRAEAGVYRVQWEAGQIASGVYFYRLRAENPSSASGQDFVQTRKMLLVR